MTRVQLHRAVARATGDDCDILMSRGFSIVDDTSPLDNEDLESLIADWDQIELEETSSPNHQVYVTSAARVSTARNMKTRVLRNARTAARARRTMDTAH